MRVEIGKYHHKPKGFQSNDHFLENNLKKSLSQIKNYKDSTFFEEISELSNEKQDSKRDKKSKVKDRLVSIVTPMYNSEKFISQTIESVLSQTHHNFEMIIVDDLSTDKSEEIVRQYSRLDSRIKYFCLPTKGGASSARNLATEIAKGEFIAFLDADDMWDSDKLEKQLNYMENQDIAFVYSDYRLINEEGNRINKIRTAPNILTFKRLLYISSSIGCLTAMYDVTKIDKVYLPYIKKRNDVAIWQRILSQGYNGYRYPEVLSSYRIVNDSLSRRSSKMSLFKYHFRLYRDNLDFNVVKSLYYSTANTLSYIYIKLIKEIKNGGI